MNIIRCHKCGTFISTGTELVERLEKEKFDLDNEINKLNYAIESRKCNKESIKEYQYLKLKRTKKIKRLHELNTEIKQVKKLINRQSRPLEKYYTDLLTNELLKNGYNKEDMREFNRIAQEQYDKEMINIRKELELIYGTKFQRINSDKWHNSSGKKDSTAKFALDNIKDE